MTALLYTSNVVATLNPALAPAHAELRAVRAQAALVRSLLDQLEDLAPPSDSGRLAVALEAQMVEELAKLACRMMTVASSLAPQCVEEVHLQQWPVPAVNARY